MNQVAGSTNPPIPNVTVEAYAAMMRLQRFFTTRKSVGPMSQWIGEFVYIRDDVDTRSSLVTEWLSDMNVFKGTIGLVCGCEMHAVYVIVNKLGARYNGCYKFLPDWLTLVKRIDVPIDVKQALSIIDDMQLTSAITAQYEATPAPSSSTQFPPGSFVCANLGRTISPVGVTALVHPISQQILVCWVQPVGRMMMIHPTMLLAAPQFVLSCLDNTVCERLTAIHSFIGLQRMLTGSVSPSGIVVPNVPMASVSRLWCRELPCAHPTTSVTTVREFKSEIEAKQILGSHDSGGPKKRKSEK